MVKSTFGSAPPSVTFSLSFATIFLSDSEIFTFPETVRRDTRETSLNRQRSHFCQFLVTFIQDIFVPVIDYFSIIHFF